MSSYLHRLAVFSARHRAWIIGAWLVALAALLVVSNAAGSEVQQLRHDLRIRQRSRDRGHVPVVLGRADRREPDRVPHRRGHAPPNPTNQRRSRRPRSRRCRRTRPSRPSPTRSPRGAPRSRRTGRPPTRTSSRRSHWVSSVFEEAEGILDSATRTSRRYGRRGRGRWPARHQDLQARDRRSVSWSASPPPCSS